MAQEIILNGTVPNDNTGDTLRLAAFKTNNNFTELYSTAGNATANLVTHDSKVESYYGDLLQLGGTAFDTANDAYDKANTDGVIAQAAYDNANTKFASAGGTISGDVNVTGNLTVTGTTTLTNVTITGNVATLNVTNDTHFANNIYIYKDTTVSGNSTFNKNVQIDGDLTVSGNITLDQIGYDDISANGSVWVGNNLTVNGTLDLRETPITELPDNLSVGGDLYLSYTRIKTPPKNISVGGSLYLRGTPLEVNYTRDELRQMFNVKGDIYRFS